MGTTEQEATTTASDSAESDGKEAAEKMASVFAELKDTARDASLSVLKPAVKSAVAAAAAYAVKKGPELLKDQVGSKLDQAGGLGGLADQALSQAGPMGKIASTFGMGGKLVDNLTGDDEDDGEAEADATGSGRRMPVQQAIDVAVPLEVAYNQWTQFEEYPHFMHRVASASQDDDAHVTFTEKIWGFSREFEAEIVEQRPNERIVWRSVNGIKHAGLVTFHELAPRLTRIEVTVDFKPESLFEKFARGARYSKRAIRADLHRFKAYIEMAEEEDGAWRGRIEGGEVVEQEETEGEEGAEAEADDETYADEEDDDPDAEEYEDEDEPVAEEEEEEEEPEEDEEEEEPRRPSSPRRPRSASSVNGGERSGERSRPSSRGGKRSGGRSRSPQRPRAPQRPRSRSSAR